MQQAPRSGTTWKRAGAALLIVAGLTSYVLSVSGWRIWMDSKLLFVILTILTPTLLSSGGFLYWRGGQYAAQASAKSVIIDAKPHLLYLRPFQTDYTTTKGVLRARLETTEEEQLAEVLRPFGELVAIGRPGESLPTPGAARIYTSDEEWKDVVKRQMRATRLVVIRATVGENVLWELAQAVSTLEPQRVLILVFEMKAEDYESFRIKANPILGVSLPERATPWLFGRVSGFISFAADWTPSFLALKGPYFRTYTFKSLATYALRPVFEDFSLEWQPPPISGTKVFGVFSNVILGMVAVVVVAAIVLALLEWFGLVTLSNFECRACGVVYSKAA